MTSDRRRAIVTGAGVAAPARAAAIEYAQLGERGVTEVWQGLKGVG